MWFVVSFDDEAAVEIGLLQLAGWQHLLVAAERQVIIRKMSCSVTRRWVEEV